MQEEDAVSYRKSTRASDDVLIGQAERTGVLFDEPRRIVNRSCDMKRRSLAREVSGMFVNERIGNGQREFAVSNAGPVVVDDVAAQLPERNVGGGVGLTGPEMN